MVALADVAIEQRDQAYYVAGTRNSLDSVAWAIKRRRIHELAPSEMTLIWPQVPGRGSRRGS